MTTRSPLPRDLPTCSIEEFQARVKTVCKKCFHCIAVEDVAHILRKGWTVQREETAALEEGPVPVHPLLYFAIYQEILATLMGREMEAVGASPSDPEFQAAVKFVNQHFMGEDGNVQ